MATLELNMMHWSGLTELTYKDCIPLLSINEDYAALFVRKEAPWTTLQELEQAIREEPGRLTASGTTSGGAWHLALAGWLMAAGFEADDVVWISSTGANPSLQELISGGVDMVCCSLPEAEALYAAGEVRAIGVMAPQPSPGYEEVPTFAAQGTDWSLGGWRALAVPLDTPDPIVESLRSAIRRIVTGKTALVTGGNAGAGEAVAQTFPEFMDAAGFDRTWREGDELQEFLAEADEKLGALLTSDAMKSVSTERYDSMAFPRVLLGLSGLTLLAIVVAHFVSRPTSARDAASDADAVFGTEDEEVANSVGAHAPVRQRCSRRGAANFALIVGGIVGYCLAAEHVGFFAAAGGLLLALLLCLRTKLWVAVIVTVLTVPLLWQLFAGLLRVPLPRGEWGF
jgi:hypothetical protein